MPRPESYKNKSGTILPGVTTITGMLDKGFGMVHAAWKLGMQNIDYKKEWHRKRDIGTLTHLEIAAFLSLEKVGDIVVPEPILKEYTAEELYEIREQAFENCEIYIKYHNEMGIEPVFIEQPFISEHYQYGGTLDLVARMGKGTLALIDFKTSPRLYRDNPVQLSAYNWLLKENGTSVERAIIVRINNGKCNKHIFMQDNLYMPFEMFKTLRQAYWINKQLKV